MASNFQRTGSRSYILIKMKYLIKKVIMEKINKPKISDYYHENKNI